MICIVLFIGTNGVCGRHLSMSPSLFFAVEEANTTECCAVVYSVIIVNSLN